MINMKNKVLIKEGIRDGFPIFLAYFAVSFALGIAAGKVGFSAIQAFVVSLTNNASAGEYAGISLVGVSAGYLEVALMVFIANARYFLMSCTLSQKFSPETPFFHRLIIGYAITDEIFAANIGRKGYIEPAYSYGVMATAMPGWAFGTAFGVIAGNILPNFAVSALSVALFGMFIAIIVPPAIKNRIIGALVLVSFALSTAANKLPIFDGISQGIKTIILTVVISLAAALIRPIPTDVDCE